jgi:hypothetical protein
VFNGGTDPITTSYDLRSPTDTYNPSNGTPIAGCTRQYPGYLRSAVTTAALPIAGAVAVGRLGVPVLARHS